jgi:predicted negative regulator of RcsB-dependent stress response
MHNGFVAGYRNASETVLGIVLFFAEDGPTLLIWLMILALPVIFAWRRYRKGLAIV